MVRDLQGEEGDGKYSPFKTLKKTNTNPTGLVIDLEVREAKETELKLKESEVITDLKHTLTILQTKLLQVEDEVLVQSTLKSSSAAADRSLDVLKSITQPLKDIQTVFETLEQKIDPDISLVELLAPPIFDLQKSLGVVEKCVAMKGTDHTLIQKTCNSILENTSQELHKSLNEVEKITLLEKELDRTKASGRITPSKITQEVCITLKEIKAQLGKGELIIKEGRQIEGFSSGSEPSSITKDQDLLSKFMTTTLLVKENLESVERYLAYQDPDQLYSNLSEVILEKLSEPIKSLVKETKVTEKQAMRYAGEKSVQQEMRLAILDKITPPVSELSRGLNVIKTQESGDRHSGVICMNVLETFALAIEDVITALTRIQANVAPSEPTSPSSDSKEVFRDVFEQVFQIVFTDTTQAVEDLLSNIEAAQRNIGDTVLLEALRQLATLQKDLTAVTSKAGLEKTETSVAVLENLSHHVTMLCNFVMDLTPFSRSDVLGECTSLLQTFQDSLQSDLQSLADRVNAVRQTISDLALSDAASSVVVVLEETSKTVVPDALLEDTRTTLLDLQRVTTDPASRAVLEPLLPHAVALYEISNDELLRKSKEELTEDDRSRLHHCVVSCAVYHVGSNCNIVN